MKVTSADLCILASDLLSERGLELFEDDVVVGSTSRISSLEAVQLIALIESFLEDRGIDYIDVFELALNGGESTINELAGRINEAINA
jgi:hypothetical protein